MTLLSFIFDFDYRESDYITIGYKAGMVIEVDDACAASAVAAGAATRAADGTPANEAPVPPLEDAFPAEDNPAPEVLDDAS